MNNTTIKILQLTFLVLVVCFIFYKKWQLKLSAIKLLSEWRADERIIKLLQHSQFQDLCYSEGTVYLFIPQSMQVKLLAEYLGLTIKDIKVKRKYAMAVALYYQPQKKEYVESEYQAFKRSIEGSDQLS